MSSGALIAETNLSFQRMKTQPLQAGAASAVALVNGGYTMSKENPLTETKSKEWREFWATQDPYDMDGVYIMSEDQSYVEDHEKVETKFKVIEYAAYDQLKAERERLKEELKGAKAALSDGRKLMVADNEYIKKLEKENAELRERNAKLEEVWEIHPKRLKELGSAYTDLAKTRNERDAAVSMVRDLVEALKKITNIFNHADDCDYEHGGARSSECQRCIASEVRPKAEKFLKELKEIK